MQKLWNFFGNSVRAIWRKFAKVHILVLGDSHVRVFEHWLFLVNFPRMAFDVFYVPGGTAMGACNPRSQTQARTIFDRALAAKKYDLVIVNLGEVDAAYTIWKIVEATGKDVRGVLEKAVTSYCLFLRDVHLKHRLLVLSASLPTLADQSAGTDSSAKLRSTVSVSQRHRTELTVEFNRQVEAFCVRYGLDYLNGDADAMGEDGLVRSDWVNSRRVDHHYARRPYARWLIARLRAYLPAD